MKQYDRDKKKWVDADKLDKKVHTRKLCKGNKPHDFVLTLPPYVRTRGSVLGIDIAEQYYKLKDEWHKIDEEYNNKMEDLGIENRYGWNRTTRHYICLNCKKQEYR